jgi:DNA polymerase III delta subunit-like protein
MQSNKSILNYFDIAIKNGILGSSYLFIGKDHSFVFDIARLIGCSKDDIFCGSCWDCRQISAGNHPDVFIIKPDGFTIKIDSVRQSIRFLSLKSYSLKRKIVIIEDAHAMGPAAANAFLKTLEEPSKNSFIAVCSGQVEDLLPTIISRCRKIFLAPNTCENELFLQDDSIKRFLKGESLKFKDRHNFSIFLWSFALLLHGYLRSEIDGQNNKLLDFSGCEIILNRYGPLKIQAILEQVLKIYGDHKTINMNLALNLIRVNL